MLPVIALVGRPNVGKSTLFNYLTRSRNALVADYPGLTRDRQYGRVKRGQQECLVIDTGGITTRAGAVEDLSVRQSGYAMDEADLIMFMVDAREGSTAADLEIAKELRKKNKPVILVVNKIDGTDHLLAAAEFHPLALGDPLLISASHGRGIDDLLDVAESRLPTVDEIVLEPNEGIKIAVVGRPNVGKSTLINRLLGEDRMITFDHPGTTRDSVSVPFQRDSGNYVLIDTAGIRKRSKISKGIEQFSVIKAMRAVDKADLVIYLIDASEGVTDQDASLLGLILESGRGILIGLNKWDGLSQSQKDTVKRQLHIKLPFLDFVDKFVISALHGTGVGSLFDSVADVHKAANIDVPTSSLSTMLQDAIIAHQPPLVRGRRIKLKFAHQGGHNPPVFVIHGNQIGSVPATYKRYLINFFRDKLKLRSTPIRLEFKSGDNPYQGRRNKLSERQIRKRKRLIRHVKRK